MSIHREFPPDPDRARSLDRRMHAELGASLAHVCERSRGVVSFDEEGMDRLIRSLSKADGSRYPPIVFADYYALVRALMQEEHRRAEKLFDRLVRAEPAADSVGQRVRALEDPGRSRVDARYAELLTEELDDLAVLPPDAATARHFEDRYRRGMDLMEGAMPDLAGEVRGIVHEVMAVVGDPERSVQFDGGSHFQLWGALFLNAERHPNARAIVEVVAHESAHSLLFGFCTEEPLVHNDDTELFDSPLREDPRPMDGIYHATFVVARMHWAMSRLLDSGSLSAEDRQETESARERDRRNFEAGYRVVAEHGELSETGRDLMDGARAYMAAAAG